MAAVSHGNQISIAVLPFENLLEKTALNYFCTGLIEDLIVDLSHFSDLRVISSYSARKLSAGDMDEIEAARNIDIQYVLKGSIWYHKNTLRITTHLLSTANGEVIWSDRFDATEDQLFELQDTIIERVVSSISTEVEYSLLHEARKKTTNLVAYDCWLRGMDQLRYGSLEADQKARDFFSQALDRDPDYAKAYAGLSLSYFNEWSCQLWDLYEKSAEEAFKYASKAYQLNESDHVIQMILGRVYLYKRQFDEAEHHIEKSLELNKNDADSLVQLASCMAFLGRAAEGEVLFQRAISLNPFRNLWYYQYGSFVMFVQGKYEQSITMALKRQLTNIWVDLPGYIAAAYAHLEDMEKAHQFLTIFTDSFISTINKGKSASKEEILQWIRLANPFKHQEDYNILFEGLSKSGLDSKTACVKDLRQLDQSSHFIKPSVFRNENKIWYFAFEGQETTMPELKGFYDIQKLLIAPEKNIHCTELMGTESTMSDDVTIDDQAKHAYKKHITELNEELDEARELHDLGRIERIQNELDTLIKHLNQNLGIGNKSRKLNAPSEKARAAVTLRIRTAIKKIESYHSTLSKHLTFSIQTGTYCRYSPEDAREWVIT